MKTFKRLLRQTGFSMLEAAVGMGLLGVGALGMMAMQKNGMKGAGAVETKINRESLKTQITQQFLSNPSNCKCMFSGLRPFRAPESGVGVTLEGITPRELGRYKMNPDGSCQGIPNPLISSDRFINGFKAHDISLTNVTGFDGLYTGYLTVDIETEKKTLGPSKFGLKIPVSIAAEETSGTASFSTCASSATADLDGDDNGSLFSFKEEDGVGKTLLPRHGSQPFNFSGGGLPEQARAVMISYTIGQPGNGRSDRKCTISGGGNTIVLGTDSRGDGGQKMIAGTAFVPIDQCGNMTMSCLNQEGGGGLFTVVAVVTKPPQCGRGAVASACRPDQILVATSDDSPPQCVDIGNSLSAANCPNPYVMVDGACYCPPPNVVGSDGMCGPASSSTSSSSSASSSSSSSSTTTASTTTTADRTMDPDRFETTRGRFTERRADDR